MANRKLLKSRTEVAIFKMSIDFNSEEQKHYDSLEPHSRYHFVSKWNEQTISTSYEEIVGFVRNVIENDLVKNLTNPH